MNQIVDIAFDAGDGWVELADTENVIVMLKNSESLVLLTIATTQPPSTFDQGFVLAIDGIPTMPIQPIATGSKLWGRSLSGESLVAVAR